MLIKHSARCGSQYSTGPKGDTFVSRIENYITDPGEEPDSSKWETEVAIKVADKK